ncbi:MAG: trimethylamine methyltransferase family protein, partial [Actinobacteria bacterium]|nr:trimethylamine methyltransferase family protein [Actinomycetota bacterium]
MPIRGLKGGVLKFLKREDLDSIHYATLEVLSEIGIKMEHKPALEIFRSFGSEVDFVNSVVKIDEHLLKKALSTAPSRFTLYGKNENIKVAFHSDGYIVPVIDDLIEVGVDLLNP